MRCQLEPHPYGGPGNFSACEQASGSASCAREITRFSCVLCTPKRSSRRCNRLHARFESRTRAQEGTRSRATQLPKREGCSACPSNDAGGRPKSDEKGGNGSRRSNVGRRRPVATNNRTSPCSCAGSDATCRPLLLRTAHVPGAHDQRARICSNDCTSAPNAPLYQRVPSLSVCLYHTIAAVAKPHTTTSVIANN
jgi:hypothetical protein